MNATASDNVGVAASSSARRGQVSAPRTSTAPYSAQLETRLAVANGSYSLTAIAARRAGNPTTPRRSPSPSQHRRRPQAVSSRRTASTRARARASRMRRVGECGVVSGAVWSAAGRFGSALSFDGVNDWVTVPRRSSLDLTSGMTVEAWVRPTVSGGWRTVVVKERTGGLCTGCMPIRRRGGRRSGLYRGGAERGWVVVVAVERVVASGGDVRWCCCAAVRERRACGFDPVCGLMVASTGALRSVATASGVSGLRV